MSNGRINHEDLKIGREILPSLGMRLKILRNGFRSRQVGAPGRTLVVCTCIIGDFLSYMPALRTFTQRHNLRFDIMVSPTLKPLAETLKGVNRVFVAKSSYNRNCEQNSDEHQVIPQNYDLMVLLRLGPEAYGLIKNVQCPAIIAGDTALLKYVEHLAGSSLFHTQVKQSRELGFEMLGLNGSDHDELLYDLFELTRTDFEAAASLPEMATDVRKILIHTGSGWPVKLWENSKWADLITRIHASGRYRIIFIGGTNVEQASFAEIKRLVNFPVFSLINKTNLRELFAVMKLSDYFIGVDSGPRNLAHYADLRSLSLLNPAAVRNFMPFNPHDIVIERPNRFPANIFNTRKRSALESIGPEELFEGFQKLTRLAQAAAVEPVRTI